MTIETLLSKIKFIHHIAGDTSSKLMLYKNTVRIFLYSKYRFFKQYIESKKISKYQIISNGKSTTIYLRVIDLATFYEVFKDNTYYLPNHWVRPNATIVDLGAHVGCTSVYFHQFYEVGTYIAVEPSSQNFRVLQLNAANWSIKTVNKAIYSMDSKVKLDMTSLQSQNHHLNDNAGSEIGAIQMETLIKDFNIGTIDLLKVDIEGTEKILFKNNPSWLKNVKIILIELHGDYLIEEFENDISPYGFNIISSENTYGIKMICAHRML